MTQIVDTPTANGAQEVLMETITMTTRAMTVLSARAEECARKVQMEGLLLASLNTITVSGETIPRLAQADLNIKMATLAIEVWLIQTILAGEIIVLRLNQEDQEVPLVVALQEHHLVADRGQVVAVAEEAGIKKSLETHNVYWV